MLNKQCLVGAAFLVSGLVFMIFDFYVIALLLLLCSTVILSFMLYKRIQGSAMKIAFGTTQFLTIVSMAVFLLMNFI